MGIAISDPSLLSATGVNSGDYFLIDQVDNTQLTGYKTKKITVASFLGGIALSTTGSIAASFGAMQLTHNDTGIASAGIYVFPLLVNTFLNGSGMAGIRAGSTFQMFFTAASGNVSNGLNFYCATSSVFVAGAPDNGTGSVKLGYGYGANPSAGLANGATNWAAIIGMDAIAYINTGASAVRRIGVQAESQGAVHGISIDTAFDIIGGTFPWNTGILFDDASSVTNGIAAGPYPIAAGGTLLKGGAFSSISVTLLNGIDLSMCGFSGSAFKSNGFAVDGFGNTSIDAAARVGAHTAVAAGGDTSRAYYMSTGSLAIFYGSGVPTISAAQGSVYLRTDGSSTSTRLYINTNGSTGWTNVVTAA